MRQWRVGSITLGLVLIAIGVGVLISNIYGIDSVSQIFKWWPLVLIALGIEVLASFFVSKEQPSTVRYSGFSVFLIIILIFAITGASGMQQIVNRIPEGFGFLQSAINKNVAVIGEKQFNLIGKDIVIDNRAGGNIDVKRGLGTETTVKATVKGSTGKQDEQKDTKIDRVFRLEGNKLTVERQGFFLPGVIQTVDLEISIPDGSTLQIDNTGRITADKIKCTLNLQNLGDVSVTEVEGDVNIKNMGKIYLDEIKGNADIDQSNGEIKVNNVSGSLNIDGGNGKIELIQEQHITADVNIKGSAGEIKVNVPESQNGSADIHVSTGNIETNIGTPDRNMASSSLTTKIGTGEGPKFTIKTGAGKVEFKRG